MATREVAKKVKGYRLGLLPRNVSDIIRKLSREDPRFLQEGDCPPASRARRCYDLTLDGRTVLETAMMQQVVAGLRVHGRASWPTPDA